LLKFKILLSLAEEAIGNIGCENKSSTAKVERDFLNGKAT